MVSKYKKKSRIQKKNNKWLPIVGGIAAVVTTGTLIINNSLYSHTPDTVQITKKKEMSDLEIAIANPDTRNAYIHNLVASMGIYPDNLTEIIYLETKEDEETFIATRLTNQGASLYRKGKEFHRMINALTLPISYQSNGRMNLLKGPNRIGNNSILIVYGNIFTIPGISENDIKNSIIHEFGHVDQYSTGTVSVNKKKFDFKEMLEYFNSPNEKIILREGFEVSAEEAVELVFSYLAEIEQYNKEISNSTHTSPFQRSSYNAIFDYVNRLIKLQVSYILENRPQPNDSFFNLMVDVTIPLIPLIQDNAKKFKALYNEEPQLHKLIAPQYD